jgi:hypothetical protein
LTAIRRSGAGASKGTGEAGAQRVALQESPEKYFEIVLRNCHLLCSKEKLAKISVMNCAYSTEVKRNWLISLVL